MKIIISDYEGTLKRFKRQTKLLKIIDLKKDLISINGFIKNGNKFVISSKRMYEPIKKDIEKYKINYNYITVGNGLITLDKNENIIYSNCLSYDITTLLKEVLNRTQKEVQIDCYNEKGKLTNFNNDKFSMIRIKFKNSKDLIQILDEIKYYFPETYNKVDLNSNILWLHNETNKSIGIDRLLESEELLKQNSSNIYTIGDSFSDSNMLNIYDGFVIKNSELTVLYDKEYVIPNIRKLIKKIK